MIQAGGEFDAINTENSKKVIDQMVERYWWLCPMRELIFDHGSAFGVYRVHEYGYWNVSFKQYLEKYGIKPILIGIEHFQKNEIQKGFLENISCIDMPIPHSKSSLSGITIDRM
jgi:putative transposase